MVKKSVEREGWQSVLIVAVVNFVGFRAAVKNYPLYQGLMWKFADEEMLNYFFYVQNIEDFRSQRNSAAEWSSNFSTVSTCKASRNESK